MESTGMATRVLLVFTLAGTVTAAGLALSAPARADQIDFLVEVDDKGVAYNNSKNITDLGKGVCRAMRSGEDNPRAAFVTANWMLLDAGYDSGMERNIISAAAANNMCPDIWPALRAAVQSGGSANDGS